MSNKRKVKPVKLTDDLPTGVYMLIVKHDDWCPRLKGPQYACTCEAEEVLLPYSTKEQSD